MGCGRCSVQALSLRQPPACPYCSSGPQPMADIERLKSLQPVPDNDSGSRGLGLAPPVGTSWRRWRMGAPVESPEKKRLRSWRPFGRTKWPWDRGPWGQRVSLGKESHRLSRRPWSWLHGDKTGQVQSRGDRPGGWEAPGSACRLEGLYFVTIATLLSLASSASLPHPPEVTAEGHKVRSLAWNFQQPWSEGLSIGRSLKRCRSTKASFRYPVAGSILGGLREEGRERASAVVGREGAPPQT